MCQRISVVFLVGVILWACSVSFGAEPVRVERAYRAADGTFDPPYRWQDLRVPIESTKINPTGNPPTFDNVVVAGVTLNVGCYQFAGNALNECFFSAQLPHGIDRSVPLEAHVHYSTSVDMSGATMTMGLEYVIVGTMQSISTATTTITGNAFDKAGGVHRLLELGEITIPTVGGDSAMLLGRLFRPGNTDSFNGICNAFEVDFHYRVGAVGSANENGD